MHQTHYTSFDKESGEQQINTLFDKHVFRWCDWMPKGWRTDVNYRFGPKRYVYHLCNPILLSETKRFISDCHPDEVIQKGFSLYVDCENNEYTIPEDVKVMLSSKKWEIIDYTVPHHSFSNIPRSVEQTVCIEFKNQYKMIPQISFQIVPINPNIAVSIKNVNIHSVEFNIVQHDSRTTLPDNTHLLWYASGPVTPINLLDEFRKFRANHIEYESETNMND